MPEMENTAKLLEEANAFADALHAQRHGTPAMLAGISRKAKRKVWERHEKQKLEKMKSDWRAADVERGRTR